MKRLSILTAMCVALGVTTVRAAELKVGDPAPTFSLVGTDGKTYKLEDFKNKQAVVVAWFPKAKTGGCTAECKSMREYGKDLRKLNVAYFTASVDTPEFNKEFADDLKVDYPILSDPSKEVAKSYGVLGEKGTAMRWTYYIGPDGKILYIDKMVKTATHGKDVAVKLKELGVIEKK